MPIWGEYEDASMVAGGWARLHACFVCVASSFQYPTREYQSISIMTLGRFDSRLKGNIETETGARSHLNPVEFVER